MKWISYGFAFLIGVISINMPHPYDKSGLGVFVLCFLALIFVGHKAAFRAHPYGIFGQYSEPAKVLGQKLSKIERRILTLSLLSAAGLGVGFLYKVNVG